MAFQLIDKKVLVCRCKCGAFVAGEALAFLRETSDQSDLAELGRMVLAGALRGDAIEVVTGPVSIGHCQCNGDA